MVIKDYDLTKEELKEEIAYIKLKLKILAVVFLFTFPVIFPLIPLYMAWRLFQDEWDTNYKPSFVRNICEDIHTLVNPPKTFTPGGSPVILDKNGNIVQNVERYFSNPNGNYEGSK